MTDNTNPVDAAIVAYLEYLDGEGLKPSLDHLNPEDRALAEELIQSMEAGYGMDPFQSRPSLDSLLAGTEYESILSGSPATNELTVEDIRVDVISSLGSNTTLLPDAAAQLEGLASDGLLTFGATRLRLQFRADLADAADLAKLDPAAAAGPIYGRFPDTAGVIVILNDLDRTSVPIGPFDVDDCIGAPDGIERPPRIRRPILPLHDTLRLYLEEVAPDLTATLPTLIPENLDIAGHARSEAANAIVAIAAQGRNARTPAKAEIWGDMGELEADAITALTLSIAAGEFDSEDLDDEIETMVVAA